MILIKNKYPDNAHTHIFEHFSLVGYIWAWSEDGWAERRGGEKKHDSKRKSMLECCVIFYLKQFRRNNMLPF
jgi:hypothetical protein